MINPLAGLTKLLFMLFIYVADVEKDITPDEVENLHDLMTNRKWTNHVLLRSALEILQIEYGALWTAYVATTLQVTSATVAQQMDRVFADLPVDKAAAARAALAEFLAKLHRKGAPLFARGGIAGAVGARQRARKEIEQLLQLDTVAVFAAPNDVAAVPDMPLSPPPPNVSKPTPLPTVLVALGAANVWRSGQTEMRCVKVTPEAPNVKTFTFVGVQPCLFAYKPGQFVTLHLPIGGQLLRRSYTISSSPSRPYSLSITVKRVPNGWVSNWLHDKVVEGFECELSGPHGDFTCLNHPADRLLLISAGSGVTPMMSMLRFLSDTSSLADAVFINNVRTPDDIIFAHELRHISAWTGPALKLGIIPGRSSAGREWNGLTGVFSETSLLALAPDFMERETFVCGPAGYMDAVRGVLEPLGYPMHRFHQESFGGAPTLPKVPPQLPPARPLPPRHETTRVSKPKPQVEQAEIVFRRSGRSVPCSRGDVILEIAETYGIKLQSSCRSGVCGACRLRKLEGTVSMDGQRALSDQDIVSGDILACLAQVSGRVVIDA